MPYADLVTMSAAPGAPPAPAARGRAFPLHPGADPPRVPRRRAFAAGVGAGVAAPRRVPEGPAGAR